MNMMDKLRSLAAEIAEAKSPKAVDDAWALTGRLVGRVPVDQQQARAVIAARDLPGLQRLLGVLEEQAAAPAPAPEAPSDATAEFTPDDYAAAMRAFKKRLKLARLNDESRLGSKQLTGGKKSEVDAIQAPAEFPLEMWHELARQGRLVDTGGGFFGLPG